MRALILVFFLGFLGGCAHVVTDDYKQYLSNNQGTTSLPRVNEDVEFKITPNTKNHTYQFRSGTAGVANAWIIKFGDVLEPTLQSSDVQKAFKSLVESNEAASSNKETITFDLVDYKFAQHKAQIVLHISVMKNGKILIDQKYSQDGISQGGKMFWAGAMGMKNGVQQSTKNALDKILSQFMADLITKK